MRYLSESRRPWPILEPFMVLVAQYSRIGAPHMLTYKAPLVSHSEQSQSLQFDIRDLVSMMGQLLQSGKRPCVSNSSDARFDYQNYDRSPPRVNTFRQRSPTPPYRQRSPSPLDLPLPLEDQDYLVVTTIIHFIGHPILLSNREPSEYVMLHSRPNENKYI